MNIAFLRRVQRRILTTDEPFNMGDWSACIAGHCCREAGLVFDSLGPIEAEATRLLGCTSADAEWLFTSAESVLPGKALYLPRTGRVALTALVLAYNHLSYYGTAGTTKTWTSPCHRQFLRAGRTFPLMFLAARSMNGGAMNLDILFNKSVDECRVIGRRGGLRAARNRRRRMLSQPPAPPEVESEVDRETMAEATAAIDALCPWLIGVEIGAAKRRRLAAAASR
jgi:hypothetical protein